jgi:hypothetical protein
VPFLPALQAAVRPIPAARRALTVLALAGSVSACGDRSAIRQLLGGDPAAARWTQDSLRLEAEPTLLFRVLPDGGGAFVLPIATIGTEGIQRARFSSRGWQRVDADFLQAGRELLPLRAGRTDSALRMFRGMWQPGTGPLDSLPCASPVPLARAMRTDGVPPFATNRPRPPLAHGLTLDPAGVAAALEPIGNLMAPSVGIPPGQLGRYERRVTLVPTGINGGTTLVVEYNDRTPPPTDPHAVGERPRQYIVVLDKAVYSYRPSYTYSTLGGEQAPPKLRLLDFLDTDDDGVPELFFGLQEAERGPWFVAMLRYEQNAWREQFRYLGNRCDS